MHVTMHVSMMRGYPGCDRGGEEEEEEGLLQQFYKVRKALFVRLIMVMIGGYEDRHSHIITKLQMMVIMMFMKLFSILNPGCV